MNSSAACRQTCRKIASNRLWSPEGWVCNPVAEFSAEGRRLSLRISDAPDREPLTEFYAGVMVENFPEDYRAAFRTMMAQGDRPLDNLLRERVMVEGGCVVVISGLDYSRMALTENSRIRKIM